MERELQPGRQPLPEIWTDHTKAIAEASQLPLILHPSLSRYQPTWGGGSARARAVKMIIEQVAQRGGLEDEFYNSGDATSKSPEYCGPIRDMLAF